MNIQGSGLQRHCINTECNVHAALLLYSFYLRLLPQQLIISSSQWQANRLV